MRALMIAAALMVPLTAPADAQTVVPVAVKGGSAPTAVTGVIRGEAYTDYRVNAAAGQTLTVTLRTIAGSPYFNVMEPESTAEAIYNSSTGEQRFSGTAAKSGDYTIRVYQMRATGRRGEVARFRVAVSVGGSAAAQAIGDALVAGTPYHATADAPCRTVAGGAMGRCKAGVIRRAGSATVHLDTPDGGERTILFRGTTAVSSDSDQRLVVERRGDTSVIRIGAVEVYEIPDALITGG